MEPQRAQSELEERNHRVHGVDEESSQSGKREKKEWDHEEHGVKEKRARSE
jgi:hypothetical protein